MKKLLLLSCLAFLTCSAFGDLLVYKSLERSGVMGGGTEGGNTYYGYWIVDLNTTNVTCFHWWTSTSGTRKYYSQHQYSTFQLSTILGKNRSFSVLSKSAHGTNTTSLQWDAAFIRGLDLWIRTSTKSLSLYPSSMVGTWYMIEPNSTGASMNTGVSITLVHVPSMSVPANDAAKSAQDVIDPLIDYLNKHGYQRY
jgi:hypothetical protein